MNTVVRSVKLCAAIYNPVAAGVFQKVFTVGGINAGVIVEGGLIRVAFAGSECSQDWGRDFKAFPKEHPLLGIVHAGFLEGMDELYAAVMGHIKALPGPLLPISATGHSLGCPHAGIFAGLCLANGYPVAELVLFAPPRASYTKLRDLVQRIPFKVAFRNGFDEVPEVPLSIPLVAPWVHLIDLTQVTAWPSSRIDLFEYHALALYDQAVEKLYAAEATT